MSFQTSIQCPDCGSPVYIESTLLLSGQSFSCSNKDCDVSISLSASDMQKVSDTFDKYEGLKQQAVEQGAEENPYY